jgi:L-2-hydroxycarboxylate dehydrogenase (NAD+)
VLRETSVSVLFDGGNQNGMVGMYHATRAAIERARPHGLAVVGVNNLWMSGRSAYYVEMAARAGLIAVHTVAAHPMVAPLGGARPALGTNPIAFGFPMEGDPLVIDLGTSAFMGTDLQFRHRLGIPLPDGVAIDEHGRPTTDAGAARRGAILPFGAHKGYALAVAMHALGVVCGGAASPERDGISSLPSRRTCSRRSTIIGARWPWRSPRSRRRRGRTASTKSAFPASARIASARVSRARVSRSTGASRRR